MESKTDELEPSSGKHKADKSTEEAKEESKSTSSSSPPLGKLDGVECEIYDMGLTSSFEESEESEKKAKEAAKAAPKAATQSCIIRGDEDLKFIIRDTVTGICYDIRDQGSMLMLNQVDDELTKLPDKKSEKHWEEWWKKKREKNQELLNAVERGQKEKILDLIDEAKHADLAADVNAKGLDDFTPLHFAVSEGNFEITEMLLKKGATVDVQTTSLRTPLHIACNRGLPSIISLLLNKGANINIQDCDGNTPTHILARMGLIEPLKEFIKHKPDIAIKNNFGETPLEISLNLETRQLLSPKIEIKGDTYSRTIVDGMILHNNRADTIKRMMFAQNMQQMHKKSDDSEKEKKDTKPTPKAPESKSRRVILLEISKKMKDYTPEDEKESGKKETKKDKEPNDGAIVGPEMFEPIQLLGRGSFGEVFLVSYKPTGKKYAMKILNKRKVLSQNIVRYARTERNVLCYTKHPFIVGLDFAFQTSDRLFMIMEFCPGGDLGHVIQREKRITEDRARIYIAEILLALEYLHQRDIIFRDLKPDNVILDEEGHALLTDFGLAKEAISDNITTNSFCGSVAYLAPEMLKKSGHGKSVDWYLLGVMMYELLVGMPPYFSPNREQLFKNIQTAPLRMPLFLSGDAKSLIVSLLNRNPSKRLGAGKTDAAEIKKHSWFSGLNWEDVYSRKLNPPKPYIKPIKPSGLLPSDIFIDTEKDTHHLAGWDHTSI